MECSHLSRWLNHKIYVFDRIVLKKRDFTEKETCTFSVGKRITIL